MNAPHRYTLAKGCEDKEHNRPEHKVPVPFVEWPNATNIEYPDGMYPCNPKVLDQKHRILCMCVCVRVCVRVHVCACVCVRALRRVW